MKDLFSIKHQIVVLSVLLLTGCARNEIKLTNRGSSDWEEITVTAGGGTFEIKELKGGASETLRFKSKAEGGGQVRGKLNGTGHETKFGYFTPNLSTKLELIFDDNGLIKGVHIP